ncbi:MAG: hypothetical protein WCA00_05765 [Candidatus Acidiferrales bacterium]
MTNTSKHQYGSELWTVIFLVFAVAVAGILYRIVVLGRLEQTSLLFIGIPAVLAVLAALTPKPESTTGAILKGITIALLLSGVLLGEGFICIVMASPLFYVVGLFVGWAIGVSRKKHNATLSCVLLILAPMSLEGVTPWLSFNRDETVQASQIVNASALEVTQALDRSPRTDLPLPPYLRMGFPRPVQAFGTGLEPGATRTIHFAGGEGKPGDLLLRVEQSQPGFVHFAVVADHSKIAHWLDWNSSDVTWTALDLHHTQVTWTIHFQRRLDPAWYFSPWERYAVRLAANYLIQANATPAPAERKE